MSIETLEALQIVVAITGSLVVLGPVFFVVLTNPLAAPGISTPEPSTARIPNPVFTANG